MSEDGTGKPRVLIVDDMDTMRFMIKTAVKALGCEVIAEAEDGQEGVDMYLDHRPDVVLLDIEMPVMTGVEALREIIAQDPDARVIMLTSVDSSAVADDCLMAGATDFIRKDLPLNEVKKRLMEALGVGPTD